MEIQMSDETKKAMKDIFEAKDANQNGIIDKGELEGCLHAVGFCPTPEDLEFLCSHFDTNDDGQLQIGELLDNLDVINAHSIHGDELMKAFRKFDLYGDGCIRASELRVILTAPGSSSMSREEANELIEHLLSKFDTNKDGKFSYPEFVRIIVQGALSEGIKKTNGTQLDHS